MGLAALILSVISLIISIGLLSWRVGEALTKHTVRLVPLERHSPLVKKEDDFREIGDPMSPEEEEYFNQQGR